MNRIAPFIEFNIKHHPELDRVLKKYKFEVDVDYILDQGARQMENGFIEVDVKWKNNGRITALIVSVRAMNVVVRRTAFNSIASASILKNIIVILIFV